MNISTDLNDYAFSGGVESALIYFAIPSRFAARSIGSDGLVLAERGFAKFYTGKDGVTREKDIWVAMSRSEVINAFETWKKKWAGTDKALYKLATAKNKHWLEAWRSVNALSEDFWADSYKIETPDTFADELEESVTAGLKQAGIDEKLLYEVISPSIPTLPRQMTLDGKLRWYAQGTWNGGEILSGGSSKKLANSEEAAHLRESLRARQQLHQEADPVLDPKTQNLVHLLRTLTLWREERKALLQGMNIVLNKVAKAGAKGLNTTELAIKWCRIEELEELKKNPDNFAKRFESSALINGYANSTSEVITDPEAHSIIQKFKTAKGDQELRGMVASSGKVKGIVRVILREHAFKRFQDGDVLVTTMTRPEFVPLMKRAKAVITDEGGLTCHAAIISRELGLPCIVGTKNATEILHDGDTVEVNANHGIIRMAS